MSVILRVGDTLRLNDQQTLKRMDYFLNLFPLLTTFSYAFQVSFHNFINAFVFFNENQKEVVCSFANLGLPMAFRTFQSDSNCTTWLKSQVQAGIFLWQLVASSASNCKAYILVVLSSMHCKAGQRVFASSRA